MVRLTNLCSAKRQTIIYGVKRGKVPTSLRPRIMPRKQEQGQTSCIEEISRMMECFKKNKYNEKECSSEVKSFLACAGEALERRDAGGARPKRTTDHINEVLQQYTDLKKKINKV